MEGAGGGGNMGKWYSGPLNNMVSELSAGLAVWGRFKARGHVELGDCTPRCGDDRNGQLDASQAGT